MLTLSPIKILIILVVAAVLVGPNKLPQVARQVGGAWRTFREFTKKMEDDIRSNMPDLPSTGDIARFARSPVALLDSLAKFDTEELKEDPGVVPEEPTDSLKVDPGSPRLNDQPKPPQQDRPRRANDVPPGDPSLN